MAQPERNHYLGRRSTPENRAMQNQPTNMASLMASEEDLLADVDEPPDLERTPRPSVLRLHESFKASFSKAAPPRYERKESLLTSALNYTNTSPVEEYADAESPRRGMSCISTTSNNSISTAELTSDGGLTSPGTRTSTPSPPLPSAMFHSLTPVSTQKPIARTISIVHHEDGLGLPVQKVPKSDSNEQNLEATLGRKRCISFACGARKDAPKKSPETTQTKVAKEESAKQDSVEPAKRVCTIKFACPSKISTDAPSRPKPRMTRAASPAPPPKVRNSSRSSSKLPVKPHRDSSSTVRTASPVTARKHTPSKDRTRRLSTNSDLARSEAYRFHEFASSEEEVDEWLQESTCHRSRLTITDTLKLEYNLRQLGEEAEEEALDDDDEDDDEDADDAEFDDDDDEELDDEDVSDEGFQTDDEEGFAGSDDDSDAGSDFEWWAPGGHSTAATSVEHLDILRPQSHRSFSESSVGSVDSAEAFKIPPRSIKRKKSRPVNIRVPSPELPDSTDFVCGTLDEDRPLEAAYMTNLERRRAARHKVTPQDIDPTFPTSDPEMDEEDEDDEPARAASDSEHFMLHGQMEPVEGDLRGRSKTTTKKRSPQQSPKRLRSPPPAKRVIHRSPPPRKLFGNSPRRQRSPAPCGRLRSPPPTRRGSANVLSPQQGEMSIRFTGLAARPALTMSSSLPRTPVTTHPPDFSEDEDTSREMTVHRAAIDIKIGLEKKRQRRKELHYKKTHRKCNKEKEKRPPPGKGYERMREMGLELAAHKGKAAGLGLGMATTPDQKDMHVLSI